MSRFQYTRIDEPVKVGVVFDFTSIRPKWFIWNRKKYPLEKVTYQWVDTARGAKHLCFSVWDGDNLYELSFNLKFYTWRLEKVYIE